jgi:hypothetical protein
LEKKEARMFDHKSTKAKVGHAHMSDRLAPVRDESEDVIARVVRVLESSGGALEFDHLPLLLTAAETASLLRTTRKAIYTRAERGLLPGAIHDGHRLLVNRDELLRYLEERRSTSPRGSRR